MRSLLFVPGGSAKMLGKSVQSGADVVIFDLEDAVQVGAKDTARETTAEALATLPRGRPSIYVRINPLGSIWCETDLKRVLPLRPDGIMLPKPEGPQDLEQLGRMMAHWEASGSTGATRVIAICSETAASTLSLAGQSWRHPRLAGLLWGAEDLATALGACGNRDLNGLYTSPYLLARNLCLFAARAAGTTPIDAVYTNFRDMTGLESEATIARRDGFSAKAAIHPGQIASINRIFEHTDAEREWARRVIEALDDGRIGAAQLDGSMVDAPHLSRARRILGYS